MSPLANHLWQSTLFAFAAGLLTLALRSNRARVRYWLWLAASVKFLIPFALFVALAGQIHWPAAKRTRPSNIVVVMDEVSQPFAFAPSPVVPAPRPARNHFPEALAIIWACGFIGIACSWGIRWRRIRAAVRCASPVNIDLPIKAMSSPTLLEPGIFGIFRPVLLLPEGIFDCLTPIQLTAVIEHELCHVRHRDNLTAAIHMFVETVFWFHPLVWWIGKRMVEERERACDEEVLTHGSEPRIYAEAILNVCKLYAESPLACVAGVTGSNLKGRIEAIMTNRITLRLTFAKKLALSIAGISVFAMPIAIAIINSSSARAEILQTIPAPVVSAPAVPPAPQQSVVKLSAPPRLIAQQAVAPKVVDRPAPAAAFEVASIKPCAGGEPGGARGGRGGGDGQSGPSPDRLNLSCRPLRMMIRMAYDARRGFPLPNTPIEGGPGWIDSDRYEIIAKAEGTPGQDMMRGPMLRALLEDRLKLKVHRESKEVPAYSLTVAKNGAKLQPAEEGSCMPFEVFSAAPPPPPQPGEKFLPICGGRMIQRAMPMITWQVRGGTLDDLATALGSDLDRIVINKTGMAGKFDFRIEFAPDETAVGLNRLRTADGPLITPSAPSDPPGGPSIFTAIQEQLGLKLEASKGPREFLIIDHIEKPTEN
jgi:bla regulator protein BlaR1